MTHIQCADFDQPMGITFLQVETYISCIQIMLALLMKSMICDKISHGQAKSTRQKEKQPDS